MWNFILDEIGYADSCTGSLVVWDYFIRDEFVFDDFVRDLFVLACHGMAGLSMAMIGDAYQAMAYPL